ncbi:MAG: hypothetical protein BWY71_02145 [Planctomycetes bacterium ADurb.Bin412]|nr:MAG: hypothetical protein BWY71_02145 [Planctomycetes bacterium ADurb.Bin412]
MDGQDIIIARYQKTDMVGNIEILVNHGFPVIMVQSEIIIFRSNMIWNIDQRADHFLPVEIGDKTVIVFHTQSELFDGSGIVDRHRYSDIDGRPQIIHQGLNICLNELRVITAGVLIADAGSTNRPGGIFKRVRRPTGTQQIVRRYEIAGLCAGSNQSHLRDRGGIETIGNVIRLRGKFGGILESDGCPIRLDQGQILSLVFQFEIGVIMAARIQIGIDRLAGGKNQ